MIKKMTNNDEKFYDYMGKIFGSRVIEKEINDRIYDDDNKQWYLYIEDEKVVAFISVNKDVIKNIYATDEKYLEKLLEEVKKDNFIRSSNVTVKYKKLYQKCGFSVEESIAYKNFVTIFMEKSVFKK